MSDLLEENHLFVKAGGDTDIVAFDLKTLKGTYLRATDNSSDGSVLREINQQLTDASRKNRELFYEINEVVQENEVLIQNYDLAAQENARIAQENARIAQENARITQENAKLTREVNDWKQKAVEVRKRIKNLTITIENQTQTIDQLKFRLENEVTARRIDNENAMKVSMKQRQVQGELLASLGKAEQKRACPNCGAFV